MKLGARSLTRSRDPHTRTNTRKALEWHPQEFLFVLEEAANAAPGQKLEPSAPLAVQR